MSSTNRGRTRNRADNYPTPHWCTRRILAELPLPTEGSWLEPCAGGGAIINAVNQSRPNHIPTWTAIETRKSAVDRLRHIPGMGTGVYHCDFFQWAKQFTDRHFNVVITNPPFSHAKEFIRHCLPICDDLVMLLRLNFLASEERADFMRLTKPDVYVLPNRPSFIANGKVDSIEYAWYHWHDRSRGIIRVLPITPLEERKKR